MPEPLIHFAVPFASLRAFGVDLRKAVLVSLVAVAPDLDVLFNVHRSQTHSVIMLAVVALPLFVLTRNRKEARTLVMLGAFVHASRLGSLSGAYAVSVAAAQPVSIRFSGTGSSYRQYVIDHWFRCADLWEEYDRVFLLIQ